MTDSNRPQTSSHSYEAGVANYLSVPNRGDESTGEPEREDASSPRPGSLAWHSRQVAKAVAAVRKIRLEEPRQLEIHAEFDELLQTGLLMRGQPMLGMTLFEVTGAGKTTTAEEYAKRANANDGDGQKSVLHVRLDNSGTARSLSDPTAMSAQQCAGRFPICRHIISECGNLADRTKMLAPLLPALPNRGHMGSGLSGRFATNG